MTEVFVIAIALVVALVAALLWWLLDATEGAYLGQNAVRWGYDRFAPRYDRRKVFNLAEDVEDIGLPLFVRVEDVFGPRPRILDVATGTGRLPLALLTIPWFEGTVVGLDISAPMLELAREKIEAIGAAERTTLIEHAAAPLPFDDASFEGAALVEALEFLPDRWGAVEELMRVIKPGGWLLVTNRVGQGARLMPGRTERTSALEARLRRMGWEDVVSSKWTTLYDRVWARKPGMGEETKSIDMASMAAKAATGAEAEG